MNNKIEFKIAIDSLKNKLQETDMTTVGSGIDLYIYNDYNFLPDEQTCLLSASTEEVALKVFLKALSEAKLKIFSVMKNRNEVVMTIADENKEDTIKIKFNYNSFEKEILEKIFVSKEKFSQYFKETKEFDIKDLIELM